MIDNIKYKTDKHNNEIHEKNLIVIGDSCREKSKHIERILNRIDNSYDMNTYTITREGVIYEHFNPKFYSNFTNINNIDVRSISIILDNMNYLDRYNDKYYNWLNEECDVINTKHKLWNGVSYWERYFDNQYISLAYLLNYLISEFKIPTNIVGSNLYDSDLMNFKGVLCRSNLFDGEYDLNPTFDYKFLIDKLNETYKWKTF